MTFLNQKNALVLGIASTRSIAYGSAKSMKSHGANLILTYQNDRLKSKVEAISSQLQANSCLPCDVSQDQSIDDLFDEIKAKHGALDTIVHSIAYAPADQLAGDYTENVTRSGFNQAHEISSYSLSAVCQAALKRDLLKPGASIVTMTYIGATRVIPCYNTMGVAKASLEANVRYLAHSLGPKGIRVNAISAGPIRTLASAGIKKFKSMLDFSQKTTPLRRLVDIDDVGNTCSFLSSDYAKGITGEIIFVDSGAHLLGMAGIDSANG
jgi:enoyl-[acyl-carrier protein] reductase I